MAIQAPSSTPEAIGLVDEESVITVRIPQARFQETPEHIICLRLTDDMWDLTKRIEGISFVLGDSFAIEQCIRIGSAAKRNDLVLDEHRYSSASTQIKSACRKMIDGKDIERYTVTWDGSWLHYMPDELYNPKSLNVLETPKILIKRIAPSLTAVPDLGSNGEYFYPLNTVYALIANDKGGYSLNYVTALLNSTFLDWYYKLLFEAIAIRGGYIEYREYLQYLPIRRIAFTTPAGERAQLAAEAGRLADSWLAERQPLTRAVYVACSPASFVAARLAAGQSDVAHDLLAALAEQMIAMHKEKQGALRAFRLDLAGYLDEKQMAKLNRLYTPKKPPSESDKNYPARLAAYQQAAGLAQAQLGELAGQTLDLDDFWQVSQAQWMWLLRQNLGQVANMSGLVTVYEQYHARLAPLMRRIRRTDWLIDQVVYQLYGLTEEEIGVVGG
jgi:hypothetical protein